MSQLPPEAEQEVFRTRLLEWAAENLREFSWRTDPSPYEVLVAELFLTQTPASRVESVYSEFVSQYPSLDALAEANREDLVEQLRPLGFQNRRADALQAIGNTLSGQGVPENTEDLMKLPYVGRYAANAVLCFGYGEPRAIVDRNVIRVYNRVFDAGLRNQENDSAWDFAEEILPQECVQTFNLALLDFGAKVCTDESPECQKCVMSGFCDYYATGVP